MFRPRLGRRSPTPGEGSTERVEPAWPEPRELRAGATRHPAIRGLAALDDALGWHAPRLSVAAPAEPGIVARDPATAGGAPAPGGAAVRLDGVSRIYGGSSTAVHAIEDVSFALTRGGFHIVSGPSGAGKSTLLRLIAGLDDPMTGH